MGLSNLPDMPSNDNPNGRLTVAGAGMALPAADPRTAATPCFRFTRIFLRVRTKKGKK